MKNSRGKPPTPTEGELAILRVLWRRGPSTVKDVHRALEQIRKTGYTTVLKFMQIMTEKGLVTRDDSTFAHVYTARAPREGTQRTLVADLLDRVFEGSTSRLVLQALSAKKASPEEISEIRRILKESRKGASGEHPRHPTRPSKPGPVSRVGSAPFRLAGHVARSNAPAARALHEANHAGRKLRYAIGCIAMLLMPVVFAATILRTSASPGITAPANHAPSPVNPHRRNSRANNTPPPKRSSPPHLLSVLPAIAVTSLANRHRRLLDLHIHRLETRPSPSHARRRTAAAAAVTKQWTV